MKKLALPIALLALGVLGAACAAIQKADPALPQTHCASGQTCPAGWGCPNPWEPHGDCLPPPVPVFTKTAPDAGDDDAGELLLAPVPTTPSPAPTVPPDVRHDGRG